MKNEGECYMDEALPFSGLIIDVDVESEMLKQEPRGHALVKRR